MCGRYTFYTDKELEEIDDIIEKINNDTQREKMKTGEIFPTNIVPVLLPNHDIVTPRLMAWGFPNFQNKGVIINARSETAREKRMFKSPLATKRCVIPSTGFYEWDMYKKKYLFNVADSQMLYMAGIYNEFDGESRFVILTTEANSSVSNVHSRMPVILTKSKIRDWIFNNNSVDDILYNKHPNLIQRNIDVS